MTFYIILACTLNLLIHENVRPENTNNSQRLDHSHPLPPSTQPPLEYHKADSHISRHGMHAHKLHAANKRKTCTSGACTTHASQAKPAHDHLPQSAAAPYKTCKKELSSKHFFVISKKKTGMSLYPVQCKRGKSGLHMYDICKPGVNSGPASLLMPRVVLGTWHVHGNAYCPPK